MVSEFEKEVGFWFTLLSKKSGSLRDDIIALNGSGKLNLARRPDGLYLYSSLFGEEGVKVTENKKCLKHWLLLYVKNLNKEYDYVLQHMLRNINKHNDEKVVLSFLLDANDNYYTLSVVRNMCGDEWIIKVNTGEPILRTYDFHKTLLTMTDLSTNVTVGIKKKLHSLEGLEKNALFSGQGQI